MFAVYRPSSVQIPTGKWRTFAFFSIPFWGFRACFLGCTLNVLGDLFAKCAWIAEASVGRLVSADDPMGQITLTPLQYSMVVIS